MYLALKKNARSTIKHEKNADTLVVCQATYIYVFTIIKEYQKKSSATLVVTKRLFLDTQSSLN